jgi:hypothetical protein
VAIVTRSLGAASSPTGALALFSIEYEDAGLRRLRSIRCDNRTAGPVRVEATQIDNGRFFAHDFPPGDTTVSLPVAASGRLVFAGERRSAPTGIDFTFRVGA